MAIKIGICGLLIGGSSQSLSSYWSTRFATLLTAVVYSDNQVDLSWTNNGVSDYTGHRIYLSKDNGVTYFLRDSTTSIGTTYRVNDLTEGQAYKFKIAPYKSGSTSTIFSNEASATTDKWYLQSGLVVGDCVAVYEPLKARTLTEAKVNVINPGTKDLTGGVDPAFDNNKGLAFNGSSQYLQTGIIPATNMTVIVKFMDSADPGVGNNTCIFGSYNLAGKAFLIMNSNGEVPAVVNYGYQGQLRVTPRLTSGVLAIAGSKAYRNGAVESSDIPSTTLPEWEIYLGCLNYNNGTKVQYFNGKVCLFAVYNKQLSPTQILAVTNRMNTVSRGGVWEAQGAVITAIAGQEDNVYEPNVIYEGNAQVISTTGNVFKIWHTGGWLNRDIYYMESLDGITNWTPYSGNPIIIDRARSCIIKVSGVYYMYSARLEDNAVDLFTSADGLSWSLDTSAVITLGASGAWDSTGISNAAIIIKDGVWYLFYDAYKTTGYWKTGVATSNDGRIFTKYGSNPILGSLYQISGPWIIYVNGFYYFWGHGGATAGLPTDMVERYKSSDLLTWTKDTQKLTYSRITVDEGFGSIVGQIADPCLVEVNNKVYFYYAGSTDGSQQTGDQRIKLAIADMPLSQLVLTEEGNKLT
jgi:hypothetical protein